MQQSLVEVDESLTMSTAREVACRPNAEYLALLQLTLHVEYFCAILAVCISV